MVVGDGGGIQPALVVAGIVALAAGVWTLRFPRGSLRRLVVMLQTDTRPVGEIEPGVVEVQGTVASAGAAVEGRMTGEDAVVTEYRQSQDDTDGGVDDDGGVPNLPVPQQLRPTSFNRGAVPFYVEDGTGRVLVDAANADLSLDTDASQHSQSRDTRAVEARLEPGDEVYVLGQAVPVEEYEPRETEGGLLRLLFGFVRQEHRRVPASAVIEEGQAVGELVITDGDGGEFLVSDSGEWRGMLRQGLMVALWTVVSVGLLAVGLYFVLDGLLGLPFPL